MHPKNVEKGINFQQTFTRLSNRFQSGLLIFGTDYLPVIYRKSMD